MKFAGEVVKSSLGVGAVAGLLFSFWQVWDQQRSSAASEQRQYADAINKAIEKSVDGDGNLRLNDAGLLFLEGIIKPGEPLRTDVDLSLARSLVGRLNAMCSKEPADSPAGARCKQLAALVQPFDPQGGTMMTAYWPGWPKDEKVSSDGVVTVSSTAGEQVSAPSAKMIPLPATQPSTGAPIDLRAKIDTVPKPETPKKGSAKVTKGGEATSADPAADLAKAAAADKPKTHALVTTDPTKLAMQACARPQSPTVRLYIQVYGPEEHKAFSSAKTKPPGKELGGTISFESVENVEATAKKSGTRPPYRWSAPTLIYHNETERACAEALANVYGNAYGPKPNVRPLPERLKKQAGAIELWVPIDGAPKITRETG